MFSGTYFSIQLSVQEQYALYNYFINILKESIFTKMQKSEVSPLYGRAAPYVNCRSPHSDSSTQHLRNGTASSSASKE